MRGDGRLYLVTDRVLGSSLDRLTAIADEAQRRAAFAQVAVDLTTALAHLHARGIMHGDVSPGNVRLAQDAGTAWRAVLIDFGLAGPPLAGGAGARGTLGYAAPEALTGARTPATDLFGLGATLFELWSGAPPFGHGLAAAQRTLAGPPPALSSIRPGLGADGIGCWIGCWRAIPANAPPARASCCVRLRGSPATQRPPTLSWRSRTRTETRWPVSSSDGGLNARALRAALEALAEGTSPRRRW